jgi:hypothetical protein
MNACLKWWAVVSPLHAWRSNASKTVHKYVLADLRLLKDEMVATGRVMGGKHCKYNLYKVFDVAPINT